MLSTGVNNIQSAISSRNQIKIFKIRAAKSVIFLTSPPIYNNVSANIGEFFVILQSMGRILAIDYGRKRCGLAVTDPLRIVATALATVPAAGLTDFVRDYCAREPVDLIVVGQPRTMSGEPSESMRYITPALGKLRKALPDMPVEMWDERFTSVLAHRAMIDAGVRKHARQDKAAIDRMSAVLILNGYLDSNRNSGL